MKLPNLTSIIAICFIIIFTNSYSQNSDFYYNQGKVKLENKEFKEAIVDFTQAIDLTNFETDNVIRNRILDNLNPTKELISNCFLNRGLAKFEIQDFEGAEKDFDNVTMIFPNFREGWFYKGKAYFELQIFELAEYGFDESLKLDSNDAEAYFRRGLAKFEQDNFKGAIADYTKSLKKGGYGGDIYFHCGRAKGMLKNFNGAIADYTKAIEFEPNNAWIYQERGLNKHQILDFDGSMKDFNRAIQLLPDARSFRCRGSLKYDRNDFLGAIEDCNQSILLDPNFPAAFNTRGLAKIQLNRKEEGCLDLSKAGELGYDYAYVSIKKYCNK